VLKQPSVKVGLISLGCAKNLVDAEIMLGSLLKEGMEITNHAETADVVIVNTCSFIDTAQEESVDAILESSAVREASHRGQGLVVSGCLPQRFREELPQLLPEVDAFMGIDQVAQVGRVVREAMENRARRLKKPPPSSDPRRARKQALSRALSRAELEVPREDAHEGAASLRGTEKFGKTRTVVTAPAPPSVDVTVRPTYVPDYQTPRFRLTPSHFAYVKIAEGCNHPCSFCIIPRMRGSHRSRSQADVVAEARQLIREGVKELNLISQDSTYYGLDLRPRREGSIAAPDRFRKASLELPEGATTLCSLLRELQALRGDFWVRLLYTHPAHWTDELISTLSECGKVARYVDMPLQHIHDAMLERMRRETSRAYIEDLIARIRSGIPGIALRTTFIVGFPGETEAYFESLLEFVRRIRFERLGVFAYSKEEGTRAGGMKGHVTEAIKHRRRDALMAEQRKISRELSGAQVGKIVRVLLEGPAKPGELEGAGIRSWEHGLIRAEGARSAGRGAWTVARSGSDAPDIDGRVYVKGGQKPGNFAQVKVTGHSDYDLFAEMADGAGA